jgi:hypothetical protein
VAHAGNPSYSGGRDQEDPGSRPSQTNRSARLYLKKQNPSQKRAGGVAQGVGPEFKPQYQKKKKKKNPLMDVRLEGESSRRNRALA